MDDALSLPHLPSGPVSSIGEAIALMTSISEALPPTDGLACFNRMYLIVTEKVQSEVAIGTFFGDPVFMSHLDVVFVNVYLQAIDGFRAEPPTAPRCWGELLANRSDTHIAPMQFALAGMSAHINHDLPIAVVKTCEDLDTAPEQGTHAADFDKVNKLLGALDQSIRESFETGVILDLDRKAAGLENLVGNLAIDAARGTAWVNAAALWRLRQDSWLSREYTDGLDVAAALAGRSLMVPLL
ncbi:MAG: DUF5995 family protein [Acidimicrobiales bacterium]|jgi:hypothetical protein